jgi:hypothetical protein
MSPKAFLVLFFLLLGFPALGCRKAPAPTNSTPDFVLEPWNFGGNFYKPPVGYVPDEETAVSIAVAVLTPIHGKQAMDAQKPFAAKLEKDIWKIKGQTVPDGGEPITVNVSKDSGCISIPSKKIGKPAMGYVPDGDTAIAIAVAAWNPIYGKKHIEEEKPYTAKFHDGHWYVEGSLPAGFNVGGTALAKISQDSGCIVGIIHGK